MSAPPVSKQSVLAAPPAAQSFKDLSPQQWRSGIAAWLGWTFDGLDMHLYTLVAAPFVMELVRASTVADESVKLHSSYIQAAFLIGWALGGGFFGRLGDLLGRSRALSLTILTYACFTGMSYFAQSWQQLLVFRFVAALGIGGEWAVGSSLLSETWPKRWRPWIAAVLQTGVNIGVLVACGAYYFWSEQKWPVRSVFLIGILPALIVFWIRRAVPETAEWHAAKNTAVEQPRVRSLFEGEVLKTTLLTIAVCATSLSAWWAFMFCNNQHMRNLPDVANWTDAEKAKLVSKAFFMVIAVSSVGNFFAGWLAQKISYRRAITLMSIGFLAAFIFTFYKPRTHQEMLFCVPMIGFCSGMFGLFTMYMPPLFPTLLRTTGAGFCYNIGRIAAALGTIYFGTKANGGDFRLALLYAGFLFIPTILVSLALPEPRSLRE